MILIRAFNSTIARKRRQPENRTKECGATRDLSTATTTTTQEFALIQKNTYYNYIYFLLSWFYDYILEISAMRNADV